nr:MAG TPA: protein of unknown function (DUF4512) [Caudoviricetes sp.]
MCTPCITLHVIFFIFFKFSTLHLIFFHFFSFSLMFLTFK